MIQKLNNFQSVYLTDLLGLENDRRKSFKNTKVPKNKKQMNSNDLEEDQRIDNEAQKEEYW